MADLNQDLYMVYFKAFEVVIYALCAITIYRKNPKYILNRTYFIALLGWTLYMLMDAILFPLGHFETVFLTTPDGKLLPLTSNILRDIAVIGGGIIAFGFVYASIIIRYGEATAKERKTLLLVLGGYLGLVIPTIIFDRIVKKEVAGVIKIGTDYNIGSIIMIAVQLCIYFFAIYELVAIYLKIDEPKEKKRVLFFILGCTFIALGVIYFIIVGLLFRQYAFITGPIGHAIWTIAPIFIYIGIKRPK